MATVNVRQLDEEVVRRLKRRAADNHRSLESEARHILEQAVENDDVRKLKDFRALSQRLRAQQTSIPQTPSHVFIRDDRESGHGAG